MLVAVPRHFDDRMGLCKGGGEIPERYVLNLVLAWGRALLPVGPGSLPVRQAGLPAVEMTGEGEKRTKNKEQRIKKPTGC